MNELAKRREELNSTLETWEALAKVIRRQDFRIRRQLTKIRLS